MGSSSISLGSPLAGELDGAYTSGADGRGVPEQVRSHLTLGRLAMGRSVVTLTPAIPGVRGLGTSEAAREYCRRAGHRYKAGVFYLHAAEGETASLTELAACMGLQPRLC